MASGLKLMVDSKSLILTAAVLISAVAARADKNSGYLYVVDDTIENSAQMISYKGLPLERYAWYGFMAVDAAAHMYGGYWLASRAGAIGARAWASGAVTGGINLAHIVPTTLLVQYGRMNIETYEHAYQTAKHITHLPDQHVIGSMSLSASDWQTDGFLLSKVTRNSLIFITTERALPAGYAVHIRDQEGVMLELPLSLVASPSDVRFSLTLKTSKKNDPTVWKLSLNDFLDGRRLPAPIRSDWRATYKEDPENAHVDMTVHLADRDLEAGSLYVRRQVKAMLGETFAQEASYMIRRLLYGDQAQPGKKLKIHTQGTNNVPAESASQ